MSDKIILFPTSKRSGRIIRSNSLPDFRIPNSFEKVTSLTRKSVSEAFGLTWGAPLVIEFKDPTTIEKRDIHLRLLSYKERIWKTKWMDRTVTPGFKRYGLIPA